MKTSFLIILSVLCLLTGSCRNDEINDSSPETIGSNTHYYPSINENEWETLSAESLGWDTSKLSALSDFLEQTQSKAFIILKDGKIVVEEYLHGAQPDTQLPWNSAAKTITALAIGIAQEEGYLDIKKSSSLYLGTGWTSSPPELEKKITVQHQLSMTTGLDYNVANIHCTESNCLQVLNNPGEKWYYHNAPYILLQEVVSKATSVSFEDYVQSRIQDKIGMDGSWNKLRYANVFKSNARSMARFGLLCLQKGVWKDNILMGDASYFEAMISSSQHINTSYGYLWWLNGKETVQFPQSEQVFNQSLITSAPKDLIAGLGKNDQKLYIVPSQNLVVIRLGDDPSEENAFGPSKFDNDLWKILTNLIQV